jgi:hypothetical protein
MNLCKCGCGDYAREGNDYIRFHNRRGLNSFSGNGKWKGGRRIKNGWVYIKNKSGHDTNDGGYIAEHRFVYEEYLGRPLVKNEIVHHINDNKLDNRIENLELMSQREHALLHSKTRKRNEEGDFT